VAADTKYLVAFFVKFVVQVHLEMAMDNAKLAQVVLSRYPVVSVNVLIVQPDTNQAQLKMNVWFAYLVPTMMAMADSASSALLELTVYTLGLLIVFHAALGTKTMLSLMGVQHAQQEPSRKTSLENARHALLDYILRPQVQLNARNADVVMRF